MLPLEPNEYGNSPNGSKWLILDENSKHSYVEGFLEGMFLGHCFTTWGLPGGVASEAAYRHATNSYEEHWKRFAADLTLGLFKDGLDSLYADEENRKILVSDGMWIVMRQAGGGSEAVIRTMIEAFRQKAAERPSKKDLSPMTYFKGPNLVH